MRQVKMTRDSFHVFQANARNALNDVHRHADNDRSSRCRCVAAHGDFHAHLIQEVADDHDGLRRDTGERNANRRRALGAARGQAIIQPAADQRGQRLDDERTRNVAHVAGEQVAQHRADACRERTHARTEQHAAQQNHAVTEVDISLRRRRDADDHGSYRGQRRHQRREYNLSQTYVFHMLHLRFFFHPAEIEIFSGGLFLLCFYLTLPLTCIKGSVRVIFIMPDCADGFSPYTLYIKNGGIPGFFPSL